MRNKLPVIALLAAIAISSFTYAWVGKDNGAGAQEIGDIPPSVTKFEVIVNGVKSLDVFVCVNIIDGLTKQEAELVAGTVFIYVKGESVWRCLKTLTFNDTQITAHYAWGQSETDLGHVFNMAADLTTLRIIVDHCF